MNIECRKWVDPEEDDVFLELKIMNKKYKQNREN